MLKLIFNKSKKGQISTEFILLITFMFLIFLFYFGAIQAKSIDMAKSADRLILDQIGQKLLTEIDAASFVENGLRYNFTIPASILNKGYSVKVCSYYSEYIDEFDFTRRNDPECGNSDVEIPELILKFDDQVTDYPYKISQYVIAEPDSIKLGDINCLRKENGILYINDPDYPCD